MASNMKAVKLRIKSVQSTMQITKAMELVASSKLRKAKERAEVCRPYFTELHETLKEIARENTDFSSVYAKESSNNKTCYVVIAGDRGLAGGYNTNLFKCLEASAEGKDYMVLPVGKKAVEYFRQREIEALTEQFAEQPEVFSMLPMTDIREESGGKIETKNLILYEPDGETVFDAIVPEYLAGLVYGGICESTASELAARRMAMDAATSNAEEMIDQLNLYYNRARQASITQEITEIVAGAEGL